MTRPILSLLALLAGSTVAAGEFNQVLSIGDKAPEWKELPGVDGRKYSTADFKKKDVLVVVFTCNSCPYAQDYEDRIVAFAKQHVTDDSKVGLVAINCNKIDEDLLPAMQAKAREKKFNFPYLFDETQKIAKDFGATTTPEFIVLNRERKVVFMGSMDDSPDAKKATRNYVSEAVTAALADKLPEKKEAVPIGCLIRFERMRRGK